MTTKKLYAKAIVSKALEWNTQRNSTKVSIYKYVNLEIQLGVHEKFWKNENQVLIPSPVCNVVRVHVRYFSPNWNKSLQFAHQGRS